MARTRESSVFLKQFDPREVLWKLFPEDAPFVIVDITDVPRPQAKKTEYVGKLKDRMRGFWVLVLAAPVQGRAIPFGMVTFSSKTLRDEGTSRNRMHHQAIFSLQDLVGDRPIVMDREFSYTEESIVQRVHHAFFQSLYPQSHPYVRTHG